MKLAQNLACWGLLAFLANGAEAQNPPVYQARPGDRDGIPKWYHGRQIAQVMGHQGAGWLERPEREIEEQPTKLIRALRLKGDEVVADIGAGSGYYTFRFATRVPKGKVLAVDIQPEMLELLEKRKAATGIQNVELVLGKEKDPAMGDSRVDLVVMVDVYHEFNYPFEMVESMVKSLKPGGRIAFVEFRLEDPSVPIKLVHKMTEKQLRKEMKDHPRLEHDETIETLPWQHIIVFKKK